MSDYATTVLIVAGINVLLAWSFYTPLAVGRLFAGQVGFYGLGAYVAAGLYHLEAPFALSVIVSGLVAAPIAYAIARLALRLSGFALAIASLGFALVLQVIWRNTDAVGGTYGVRGIEVQTTILSVVGMVLLVGMILWGLERSRHGKAAIAVRNDREAARAMGIHAMHYEIASTVLGCMIAGSAGAMYVHFIGFVQPDLFGFSVIIAMASWTFFGGTTTFWGPLLGGFSLTVLPQVISWLYDVRLVAYACIVILVVLFRPDGVLTRRGIARLSGSVKKSPEVVRHPDKTPVGESAVP